MTNFAYLLQQNPAAYPTPEGTAAAIRGAAIRACGTLEKFTIAKNFMNLSDSEILRNHQAELDEQELEII